MRFLSVCSGIEAASVAWNPLGWKAAAFAEIEPFPCAVLAHHYPDVPNLGDMTKYQEWPDDLAVDLLCGGTPCQSFSIAGLRKGLADPRGNLALTFLAIAAKYRPRWLVWENVPGVLSSITHPAPDARPPEIDLDGGDGPADGQEVVVEDEYDTVETHAFSCFLAGLSELGYGFAVRSLDAQFSGLAQRRERVFVVGCLGDWRSAAAVLSERHSLSGHPPPSRKARQGFAASTAPSLTASGRGVERTGESRGQDPVIAIPVITQCHTGGGQQRYDPETETLIPTIGGGFDVAHSPAYSFKSGQSEAAGGAFVTEDFAPTLQAINNGSTAVPAVAFQSSQSGVREVEAHATLDANNGSRRHNGVIQAMQVRRLTPGECLALQGFPRDYLDITYRGKPAADGPKYKATGNSWAVPVVRWIGERIDLVEAIHAERLAA